MSKLTASPDISAFLASSTKTQARANIGFNLSPVVVSNETARKTSGSYVGGPQVGATRVIQADTPNIVWHLIAADITNDNSWIGQPYTSDSSGIIDVDLEISDVSAIVPNIGVIGRVGKNLTLGDGKTVGGYRIDTGVRSNQLAITVIDPAGDGVLSGYDLTTIPNNWQINGSLTVAHIGNRVTSFGYSAFNNCRSLTSITLPDSLLGISDYTFNDCSSLSSVTLPDSVTSIGNYAFHGCSSLSGVTLPDSLTSIGGSAFQGCTSFTSITLPDSVTSIGSSAFSGCSSLTSITLPDSVTNIGSYVFYGCSSLTSIDLPDSLTSIAPGAFYSCSSLTSITLPDSLLGIGTFAFSGCSSLTSITLPDSLLYIDSYAFSGCTSLSSITIGVQYLDESVFSGCSSLSSVTLLDSLLSIGAYTFRDCTSLSSITIPDSVTSIGSYAFYNCSSLTEANIYVTKTIIDAAANIFGNSGLATVYARASDTTWTEGTGLTIGGKSGVQVIRI